MKFFLPILLVAMMLAFSSCQKGNCYNCQLTTECMECVKARDSLRICAPVMDFGDSLKRYQGAGYTCTINSGLRFSLNVCDDDSFRLQLQHDEYVCTKE